MIEDAIKNIQNYYLKKYNIPIEEEMSAFLNAILQDIDNKSWKLGYNNALEDTENDY